MLGLALSALAACEVFLTHNDIAAAVQEVTAAAFLIVALNGQSVMRLGFGDRGSIDFAVANSLERRAEDKLADGQVGEAEAFAEAADEYRAAVQPRTAIQPSLVGTAARRAREFEDAVIEELRMLLSPMQGDCNGS
jgi:hypothetical protein